MKTRIALLAVSLSLTGFAFAQDAPQQAAPAPQKKAAPAKPVARPMQHDHDNCPMMQGGMMGKGMMGGGMMGMGGMGMMGGHDAAAHAAMEKRLEQMEKRLDLMQALIERRLKQEPATK